MNNHDLRSHWYGVEERIVSILHFFRRGDSDQGYFARGIMSWRILSGENYVLGGFCPGVGLFPYPNRHRRLYPGDLITIYVRSLISTCKADGHDTEVYGKAHSGLLGSRLQSWRFCLDGRWRNETEWHC